MGILSAVDERGGMVAAIEQGYVQTEIHNEAYAHQLRVESGEQTVVGVNRYRSEDTDPVPVFRIDPREEDARIRELSAFRSRRDGAAAAASLDRLRESAHGSGNLMPPIRAAVESHATLGEISDALRDVFGTSELA